VNIFHLIAHQFGEFFALARRRFEEQFVVHLQNHLGFEFFGGESAVDEDFSFHCSIADATGNAQFKRFLDYLGRFIIPRQSIRKSLTRIEDQRAYLKRIQNEHMEILDAIRAGAAATARAAMRRHLVDSRKRYQKLVAEIGNGPAAAASS